MKFYKPQVQLIERNLSSGDKEYFLHAVTFCRRTNFVADGLSIDDSDLADGVYKVTLKLRQDPVLPDYQYITPVVHTVALGAIDFPDPAGGWFEIGVEGVVLGEDLNITTRSTQAGPTTTVSSTDADDDSRPGGSGMLR